MTSRRLFGCVLALLLASAGISPGTVEDGQADGGHHVYIHLLAPGDAGNVQVTVSDETEPVGTAAVQETGEATPAETPSGDLPEATVDGTVSAVRAGTPAAEAGSQTNMALLFFVFVLAIFLGFELIAKVPSQLHTPLMSGSNAVSGITIVGALIAAGQGHAYSGVTVLLGSLAVAFAMINVVGGYLVTDRMLSMFKHKGGRS